MLGERSKLSHDFPYHPAFELHNVRLCKSEIGRTLCLLVTIKTEGFERHGERGGRSRGANRRTVNDRTNDRTRKKAHYRHDPEPETEKTRRLRIDKPTRV